MIKTLRHIAIAWALLMGSTATVVHAGEPSGGIFGRLLGRFHSQNARPRQPLATDYATAPAAAAVPSATESCDCPGGGDPYGFAAIVNHLRARAGLHPLAYDENLSSWASQNNAAQCRHGIGHHVNPNCFQNCGWNYSDASSVAQGWMDSPGHRENLLSPSASRFGLAFGPGPYWTFNAR